MKSCKFDKYPVPRQKWHMNNFALTLSDPNCTPVGMQDICCDIFDATFWHLSKEKCRVQVLLQLTTYIADTGGVTLGQL